MNDPTPKPSTAWFITGIVLGSLAWFRVFMIAFFAPIAETSNAAAVWWFLGASLISGGIAACQPSVRIIWSLGFAVPIVGWCVACTFYAIGDVRFLWWTLFGGITALTSLLGALVGRAAGKKFR